MSRLKHREELGATQEALWLEIVPQVSLHSPNAHLALNFFSSSVEVVGVGGKTWGDSQSRSCPLQPRSAIVTRGRKPDLCAEEMDTVLSNATVRTMSTLLPI